MVLPPGEAARQSSASMRSIVVSWFDSAPSTQWLPKFCTVRSRIVVPVTPLASAMPGWPLDVGEAGGPRRPSISVAPRTPSSVMPFLPAGTTRFSV